MQQKSLKCKFQEQWNDLKIVELPLQDLWVSVPVVPKFQTLLEKDLIVSGMTFPILVVHATMAQLRIQKEKYRHAMLELPKDKTDEDMIYVVWGGSQRVTAARKLRFTHIDCVVYEGDFDTAFRTQALQRKEYNHWYSSTGLPK